MDRMGDSMETLKERCREMENILQLAFDDTKFILNSTNQLKQQSLECDIKMRIARAIGEKFTFGEEETKLLTTPSEPINQLFFGALEKLQRIQKNCTVLLAADDQGLGLEVMDTMNGIQESAYERLFKWTLYECRMLKYENPEVSIELRQAMHSLRLRPILFKFL
jgi:hypothetical protein